MMNDTIGAVSTPMGEGGIAVLRVSGDRAVEYADRIFAGKVSLLDAPSHTVQYGHIVNPDTHLQIEEVLVTVMRAPRSFTREDVVEVSCHGGYVSVRNVLDLLLEQGVRLAEPGEFTKRAFLNGRIDLSQAEAVMDLIRSKSDRAYAVALRQAEGALSRKIQKLRNHLVEIMAHIEVNIDYPEHDVEELTNKYIRENSNKALRKVQELLKSANEGKILREGIESVIIGRPNVGKSSLLNELAQENRAIVTDIPGTTRDLIEEYVTVGGIPLKLLDTAGIRETEDVVERIGVEKSRSALSKADLILFVISRNEPLHEDEHNLLQQLKNKPVVVIVNKMDLDARLDMDALLRYVPSNQVVHMSLIEHSGVKDLEKAIGNLFFGGRLESNDIAYVSNARHIQLLKQTLASLEEAIRAAEQLMPIDIIQIDIRTAWERLGEITGDSASDTLLDEIFSRFCLGK